MRRICVYCGSAPGNRGEYAEAAIGLAAELVRRGIGLVYGGSSKGIMGVLADAVLERGGSAVGVMPHSLVQKEIAHSGLTELHVTATMHERKALMADMADGFIAMPGGFGTLEEIVEVLTWGQLRFHAKPCGLLNVAGYYDRFLAFVGHATNEGFVREGHREMLLVAALPAVLLDKFASYSAPELRKWVD
ncbi:MAG: TIGR00730 family Rossman fold protein [Gammaproteobacteria bacterium]|nr:TIGR00730 family Rossman fold protein [Gammaproteobacteria bacterium]MDH4256634.1 TIGR00730 family Rossman fold protein [Gammaproteobacteria bacterium]MDH5309256.1 TIGR00730 family Rossman fold protein [Gammaproteobacteria bacterium]